MPMKKRAVLLSTSGPPLPGTSLVQAWYKRLGVKVTRVMTNNGSCYIAKAFTAAGWKLISVALYAALLVSVFAHGQYFRLLQTY